MDSDRERAIRRVRKLRALAADRAATGPEAELAAQRAKELMARHALAEADVAPEPARRPARRPVATQGFVVTTWGANTTSPFVGPVTGIRIFFY